MGVNQIFLGVSGCGSTVRVTGLGENTLSRKSFVLADVGLLQHLPLFKGKLVAATFPIDFSSTWVKAPDFLLFESLSRLRRNSPVVITEIGPDFMQFSDPLPVPTAIRDILPVFSMKLGPRRDHRGEVWDEHWSVRPQGGPNKRKKLVLSDALTEKFQKARGYYMTLGRIMDGDFSGRLGVFFTFKRMWAEGDFLKFCIPLDLRVEDEVVVKT